MRVIGRNHLVLALCAVSLGAGSALADDRPQPPNDRPGEGAPGPHRKPPEAAFSACSDLEEDDVCEVALPDKTIEGKCVTTHDEARLHCRPDQPPAPPR